MLKQWLAGVGLVAVLLGPGCVPEESEAAPEPVSSTVSTPVEAPAGEAPADPPASEQPDSEPAAGPGTAAAVLATLEVKGRAPKTGYDRAQFGQRWADIDRNGCDQRNDILLRDLTQVTFKPGTRDCVVAAGSLADPFTGTLIEFVRGEGTSNAVQIDHVVALSDAWQKGGQQLDLHTREQFANDPLNLLAVDGPSNGSKGDGDAATWLPPNKAFRCQYVARQVAVKAHYQLWVTQAEHDAIAGILNGCPNEPLPTDDTLPQVDATAPAQEPAPTTEPPAESAVEAPAEVAQDVHYKNCTAVRVAGAAPIHEGETGYGRHLDRDGIGCE